MNRIRITCTMVLCLLFTMLVFALQRQASAQEEPRKPEATSPQTQEPEAKPERRAPEAKPEKQEKQETAKPEKQEKNKEKESKPAAQPSGAQAGTRAQGGQTSHAHPAGKSAHIPNDKFRANFGRNHTFVISQPVVVNNQPTFQYGGFTFIILDPWPAEWAYTDDCYIDFVDGDYFLFDMLHPGVSVALFVEM